MKPTVRDRVVQAAVRLILEPIFEADFEECSHGFRPGRSAHDALRAINLNLKTGLRAVYDADLAGYFDSIPHGNLEPSRKAMAKEREALRGLINPQQCHTPLPDLIARVNRHSRGWANYWEGGAVVIGLVPFTSRSPLYSTVSA